MILVELYRWLGCLSVSVLLVLTISSTSFAVESEQLHPRNKLLVKLGLIPESNWVHPSVPRITASQALLLYQSGKARIAWCGDDGRKVIGAYHLTGMSVYNIPERVKLAKGQALLLYCD